MPHTFKYIAPDGHVEMVDGEPWFWVAYYHDGGMLSQFDAETRTFHRFAEIDLERLAVFEVRRPVEGPSAFSIRISPGMRPIFFKRHQRLYVGTPHERHDVLFCFGYQETVGGRNVKTLLTLRPDGTVTIENHDGRVVT